MSTVAEQVNGIFRRLSNSELSAPETGQPGSGWETHLPSGQIVTRSALQEEARPLIALGPDAVPELLPWVGHENPALRYVAVYALEQISGEKSYVPHFAQTDDEGHRAKAVDKWRRWYEARTRGPDQKS